jgi:hypothetical protein
MGMGATVAVTKPVAATLLVIATLLSQPAFGADLGYGPYAPQPYGYQQQPPYEDDGGAYPPHRYVPSRQGAYAQPRYVYQPPPYDYRGPAYPPPRYIPDPSGLRNEDADEYETYGYRRPAYPYYRYAPYGYDYRPRGNGYRRFGYVDQY